MASSATLIGDRRRAALARSSAMRRHPTRRTEVRPATPPPSAFYVLAVVTTVLTMLGLVMVMSATSIKEFHDGRSPWGLFNRQLLWAIVGCFGLWFAMRVPLHRLRRLVFPALVAAYGVMLLPFLSGVGSRVNDASSWVELGPLNFQPSEFLKLAVLFACSDVLARRHSEMHDPARTMLPVAIIALIGSALCLAQGDLGSAIVLGCIVFAMLFVAGAPLLPMMAAGSVGIVGALAFVASSPRRQDRFTAFLDIAAHKDHLSYQTYQAMIAMAQGGVTGSGVGRGDTKLGEFLPLAQSDFIFAVVAEELGMIGVVAVLGGFMVLAYAGIQVALAAQDRFHQLLAGGIVCWLVVQTIINVGGVTGLMPVTGLTLPFFSTGGSSLLATLVAMGVLLNVARNVR